MRHYGQDGDQSIPSRIRLVVSSSALWKNPLIRSSAAESEPVILLATVCGTPGMIESAACSPQVSQLDRLMMHVSTMAMMSEVPSMAAGMTAAAGVQQIAAPIVPIPARRPPNSLYRIATSQPRSSGDRALGGVAGRGSGIVIQGISGSFVSRVVMLCQKLVPSALPALSRP